MYSMITYLQNLNYIVRIRSDKASNQLTGLFFIHEDAIKETRSWPEALTIDATYKTNAHKISLVNIVGTSNTSSIRKENKLQTFAVAAAFVNSETEEIYTWILEELRDAVWSSHLPKTTLPSVFVTDNEQALRNAIESVFPESQHLLCTWHLWNTMSLKLAIGNAPSTTYNFHLAMAEVEFQKAMTTYNEGEFRTAISNFQSVVSTKDIFKENGVPALTYLKDTWVSKCVFITIMAINLYFTYLDCYKMGRTFGKSA